MFFYKMLLKKQFNPQNENVSDLLASQKKINKSEIIKNLNKIYQGSFKGNCGDFQTDSDVLNYGNIKNLQSSFKDIIRSIIK